MSPTMKAIAWRFIDDFAACLTRTRQARPGQARSETHLWIQSVCVAATAKSTAQLASLHDDDEPAVIVELL